VIENTRITQTYVCICERANTREKFKQRPCLKEFSLSLSTSPDSCNVQLKGCLIKVQKPTPMNQATVNLTHESTLYTCTEREREREFTTCCLVAIKGVVCGFGYQRSDIHE
jgi:hypothetical protein